MLVQHNQKLQMPSNERKQSTGLLGCLAGVIAAGVLQPLENIKIAMMLPPKDLKLGNNIIYNLIITKRYIGVNEGIKGFFKGLVASSLRAGCGSFLYFEILRSLEHQSTSNSLSFLANFSNSLIARVISTFISNPLSVIETRYEMANFHGYNSIYHAFKQISQKQGWGTFFKGGLTSCLKQGVFAGFYYMLYQEFKELGCNKPVAGLLSGLLSTTASHPLQIIRAKLQTQGMMGEQSAKISLRKEFGSMLKQGSYMKGLTPRLMKKPLANTITFVIFESFEEHRN